MSRWRTRHRGPDAERGAAAVEFAIVLVVLLIILLGIIDFGRLLFVSQSVKSASREAARAAVIDGTLWGSQNNPYVTGTTAEPGSVAEKATEASRAAGALAGTGDGLSVLNSLWGVTTTLDETTDEACGAKGSAVTITVTAPFAWVTPVGALAGGFFTPDKIESATTMRCE